MLRSPILAEDICRVVDLRSRCNATMAMAGGNGYQLPHCISPQPDCEVQEHRGHGEAKLYFVWVDETVFIKPIHIYRSTTR